MTKKQATPAGRTRKTKTTKGAKASRATTARDPRLQTPGSTLTRTFKGRELRVKVLGDGFEYEGKPYRSLTAVALAITGYLVCSGPHFCGLDAAATSPARANART